MTIILLGFIWLLAFPVALNTVDRTLEAPGVVLLDAGVAAAILPAVEFIEASYCVVPTERVDGGGESTSEMGRTIVLRTLRCGDATTCIICGRFSGGFFVDTIALFTTVEDLGRVPTPAVAAALAMALVPAPIPVPALVLVVELKTDWIDERMGLCCSLFAVVRLYLFSRWVVRLST